MGFDFGVVMMLELGTQSGLVHFVELDHLLVLPTFFRLTKLHIFTNIFMGVFSPKKKAIIMYGFFYDAVRYGSTYLFII